MPSQFNSYIDFLDLTAATDFCREKGVPCLYKKGEHFVQQGTVTRYAALVVSGYFKVVTLNDSGNEAVINFAFPGQFITDFHSSLHGEPSQMSIIAGSDCEILRIPLKTFKEFLSPSLLDEYKSLFNMIFMRLLNLYRKSPRQRYVALCEQYPQIVETVTLKDLSSFLLITPNHLSRIRRELTKNPDTNIKK
jgi:hypothetical protein